MREIKFRAWDNNSKQMQDMQVLHLRDLNNPMMSKPIMQFTGLKDKNGKEIYDGDIIWNSSDEGGESFAGKHEVTFKDGIFGILSKSNHIIHLRSGIIECLGNIYENPKLLKS